MIVNRPVFSTVVVELDKPTRTGRIYSKECFKDVRPEVYGYIGNDAALAGDLNNIAFLAKNVRVENNKVLADIKVLGTPMGDILNQIMSTVKFITVGYGYVSTEGVVTDYRLISISAMPKDPK